MIIVFASLTMLFGATVVAYFITRAQNPVWRTTEMPPLPLGLWLSTLTLAGLSGSLELSLRAVRANRLLTLQRWLVVALACSLLFIASQIANWQALAGNQAALEDTLYAFTFYMLTGTHALHVFAGLVPLGLVIYSAYRMRYTSNHHDGLRFCVQYWHFLGIVWVLLLGAMHLAT